MTVNSIRVRYCLVHNHESVKRLCRVIQFAMQIREWSGNALARAAGIRPSTALRYMAGDKTTLVQPNEEVIKAIAPFVFRVVNFNEDGSIDFDPSQTYEDNWRDLWAIGLSPEDSTQDSPNGNGKKPARNRQSS